MSNYKNQTILVVEGNMINRRIMTQFFNNLGCNVDSTSSCSEAFEMISLEQYDAIFIDLLLSSQSDFGTAKKIKEVVSSDTVICAVSGNKNDALTKDLEEVGYTHLIHKPVQKEAIEGVLSGNAGSKSVFQQSEFEAFFPSMDLRKEIVMTFLDEQRSDEKRLVDAFKKNTSEEVYKAVHYMKGSFGYLKAMPIFDVSKVMCDFIKEGKYEEAIVYKDEFMKLYNDLVVELKLYARKF